MCTAAGRRMAVPSLLASHGTWIDGVVVFAYPKWPLLIGRDSKSEVERWRRQSGVVSPPRFIAVAANRRASFSPSQFCDAKPFCRCATMNVRGRNRRKISSSVACVGGVSSCPMNFSTWQLGAAFRCQQFVNREEFDSRPNHTHSLPLSLSLKRHKILFISFYNKSNKLYYTTM